MKLNMSLYRIKGILLHEYFITLRSLEVIVDILIFPLLNIAVFGFLSLYLSGSQKSDAAYPLLLGMILWQVMYITQYSISVGSLWNIWSRNLSNIFLTPVSLPEYIGTHVFSGIIKSLVVLVTSSVLSVYLFHFSISQIGYLNITLFFINLIIFAVSTGVIILALIFCYGTRIQALAWSVTFLFQPLTAAFFPVSILPVPLQKVAYLLPPTYVFEAARKSLTNTGVDWHLFLIASGQNVVYFVISIFVFKVLFKKSKESGQFARNEG